MTRRTARRMSKAESAALDREIDRSQAFLGALLGAGALPPNTRISVSSAGRAPWETTWAVFAVDDIWGPDAVVAAGQQLADEGWTFIGGGAAPLFKLTVIKEETNADPV